MKSWLPIPPDSDFSIHNLPYGIFEMGDGRPPRAGIAVGDQILDLQAAARLGFFSKMRFDKRVFSQTTLNEFIRLGRPTTRKIRLRVQAALCDEASILKREAESIFHNRLTANLLLPISIGDLFLPEYEIFQA